MPVNDTDRAKKFYHEAFGWNIEAAPGMPYWMIQTANQS